MLIGCYYWPPEGSEYLITNFSEVFEEQLTNVVKTNKEIIILGDFKMIVIKQKIEIFNRYLTSSD